MDALQKRVKKSRDKVRGGKISREDFIKEWRVPEKKEKLLDKKKPAKKMKRKK